MYDPIFILRFSVHCLSMGFIEPLEFASLGLLAISAVSISSPDDDMRKLGYEVLGRFKSALEVPSFLSLNTFLLIAKSSQALSSSAELYKLRGSPVQKRKRSVSLYKITPVMS